MRNQFDHTDYNFENNTMDQDLPIKTYIKDMDTKYENQGLNYKEIQMNQLRILKNMEV